MPNQVETYVFSIACPKGVYPTMEQGIIGFPDRDIRIQQLFTSANEPMVSSVSNIYMNRYAQLAAPIDPYFFSSKHAAEVREQFLAEHKLAGMSSDKIQAYLDKTGLHIPNPCRIELGTIIKGEGIHITGLFNDDFVISFIGAAKRKF